MEEMFIAKITFADSCYTISPRTGAKLLSTERYVALGATDATAKEAHVYLISVDRHPSLEESYLSADEKIISGAGYQHFNPETGDIHYTTLGFVNPALSCVVPMGVLEPLDRDDMGEFLRPLEELEDFADCLAVNRINKYLREAMFSGQGWQINQPPICDGTSPRDAFIRNEIAALKKIDETSVVYKRFFL